MNIGYMRSRITIQKQTVTVDSVGNRMNTWSDWHTCSAYVNLNKADEHAAAGQTVPTETLVFTVRYCATLSALATDGYRISFGGHLYDISSVDDYRFRHETLKLTASRTAR